MHCMSNSDGEAHNEASERFISAITEALQVLRELAEDSCGPGEAFMEEGVRRQLHNKLANCMPPFINADVRIKPRPTAALKKARKDKSFQSFMASQCLTPEA